MSFEGPRDGNEAAVVQGASVWGLPRAALRQVQGCAAIIAWMQGIVSLASRVRPVQTVKEDMKPQVADEAAEMAARLPEETRSDQRENSTDPRALGGAEGGLAERGFPSVQGKVPALPGNLP